MTADPTAELLVALKARGLTLAVAESLTGGALSAELTRPAGASAVVRGGLVVYATEAKHTLAGVDASLLEQRGPVDPEVAAQLASGARERLAIGGTPADIGVSVTGVAGPDRQHGIAVGTVYVGVATADGIDVTRLQLTGDRDSIRAQVIEHVIVTLAALVADSR